MSVVAIENNQDYIRDTHNNAVINSNSNGYMQYKNTKNKLNIQKAHMEEFQKQVNIINSEIAEMKQMLLSFLNK